ncbi:DUF3958 family protein [Streptococcus acidominimus]|uniref:Uncharacterized protein n=1 Tax=Streptococcus acidominimus TaxID=1326 RepID=A0A4Y9FR40_STRAI|nr:DUF3958 family protein [Streptococcus acidominimus]MBF0818799.1 DUF3958 family protein [Streptococcus acidominimus]MBF0839204.1 DUF3958 family protein [Streptococcus acidominimus]MBF0849155.1 DUF3958 family protein [Streptococcus danieliae]TFU30749.1 hypothetical protein E4U01_04940 [Streptococcus acidominimus]
MNRSELREASKRVNERLAHQQELIKARQMSMEELGQLSKESDHFLRELVALLHGSSDRSLFQGLVDEQLAQNKKIKTDLEREYEELLYENRRLTNQAEELAVEQRRLEEEET